MRSPRHLLTSSRLIRLQRLVASGHFPSELPPPFSTRQLSQHADDLVRHWNEHELRRFITRPEIVSVPRARRVRRQVSIVNPISQLHLSDLIARNWTEIRARLNRSEIGEFEPLIQVERDRRAIAGIDFGRVHRRKIAILARYGRYVQTDIVRFFPSLPTHTIAWGLLGRAWVQNSDNEREFRDSEASRIVAAVRSGQGGDETGIPIGPDTSRILSELVATELEDVLRGHLPDLATRGVRYVDDVIVGINEDESPDAVVATLSSALYEFDLQLNDEKTSTQGVGISTSPDWLHFIRQFQVSERTRRQREDLESFFTEAMHRADQHPRAEVLLYATKVATSFPIREENRNFFVRWLLYAARRSPSCLSYVAEHLAFQHRNGQQGAVADVHHFIRQQIRLKARAAHTLEVAWLLFWARETETRLPGDLLEDVTRLRSGVCALLTLDLIQRGFVDGSINSDFWRSFATDDGLSSEMWLVAYEASLKRWWPQRTSRSFIRDHRFFGELLQREISFYDPGARPRREGSRRSFSPFDGAEATSYLQF